MEIAVQEHSSQCVQTFADISKLTVCASEPEVHVIYTFVQLGFNQLRYFFSQSF